MSAFLSLGNDILGAVDTFLLDRLVLPPTLPQISLFQRYFSPPPSFPLLDSCSPFFRRNERNPIRDQSAAHFPSFIRNGFFRL